MYINTLLADPEAIRLDRVRPSPTAITLIISTTKRFARCPRCHRAYSRVHSRYTRSVANLPWHGISVRLALHARRFCCRNSLCTQRIFCERLPSVVAHYARKTIRLNAALELIGFAVGGEAGARIAKALGLTVSPDALLRRLHLASQGKCPAPRVIGVDDFAFRRGRRYGTLLVDLERRLLINVLPDREAETLSAWLKAHPGIEIGTRDRSRAYANGITGGAPTVVQVADRWHLLKNLREALEQFHKRVLPAKDKRIRGAARLLDEHGCTPSGYTEQSRLRLLPHLLRRDSTPKKALPSRPPPPRDAAWMLLQPERVKDEERAGVERLYKLFPEVKVAQELAPEFARMVRQRKA